MKKILTDLQEYFRSINRWVLFLSTAFTAFAIYCNYHFHLNQRINRLQNHWQYVAWFGIFLAAFSFGYWLQRFFLNAAIFSRRRFLYLLLIAPAIFAWKMSYRFYFPFSTDFFKDEYWNAVAYWPFKVVVITAMLVVVHRLFSRNENFYGLTTKNFSVAPYLFMLLLMVPLVAAAATQKDFLQMYPRMQNIDYLLQPGKGFYKLLYELSYGSDFFSIELFFRGFLVLAFAEWAGKNSILPMAIFYCTIHFGKPLGECISSYFGGLILGVVAYNTRTILGGFMVHVGIAWLMEVGGYIGNALSH